MGLRPYIAQAFIARPPALAAGGSFERAVHLTRKRATQLAWAEGITNFYIASLSSKTVVYKGLFVAPQLALLHRPDRPRLLHCAGRLPPTLQYQHLPDLGTGAAIPPAVPQRRDQHLAREHQLDARAREPIWVRSARPYFGEAASTLLPVISERGSDSAMLDNALDLLMQAGRDVRHALMMLAPRAWQHDPELPGDQRAFFRYHSCLQEPWDRAGAERSATA